MKSSKIWRIIWIVGIYAILVLILLLVINYKVKWESKDLNTYLYFYNCNNNLCSSSISQKDYYNRVLCEDDICPYIKEINDNVLVLSDNNKTWLYDYVNDKILNNKYIDYRNTKNNYIVTNKDGKQGVIDIDGNILVDFEYDYIKDYRDNMIVIGSDKKYGVVSLDKNINVEAKYDDIILINNSIYAYMNDNKYYLANYSNNELLNNVEYDYIYSDGNIIFVVKDNKFDILNLNLNSLLLMKMDTFYSYKVEKERATLKINSDNSHLTFSIYMNENEIKKYIFDKKNNKLF